MTALADIIETLTPSDSSTGVPLNKKIEILFDREIDTWSIEAGGFVLEGPDTDQVIYPSYQQTTLIHGTESQILESPGLKGLVKGTFTYSRVSLTTTDTVGISDTTGDGTLFRTKMSFLPDQQLTPLTSYKIYLFGDEDLGDDNISGIRSRTVFDGTEGGSNAGDGIVTFSGTYLGDFSNDVINIRITKDGVAGVAEYETWRNSQVLDIEGPLLTSISECQTLDGVTVFFGEGTFQENDTYSVVVKRPVAFEGSLISTFTTGNGSITVVPTTTSTSITGDPALTVSTGFSIVKTTPSDGATDIKPEELTRIVVEFSNDIDPSTITADTVQLNIEPVIDHPLLSPQVKAGPLSTSLTVSGHFLFIDL